MVGRWAHNLESKLSDMDRGFPSLGLSVPVCKMGTPQADRTGSWARGHPGGTSQQCPRAGPVTVTRAFRCRAHAPAARGPERGARDKDTGSEPRNPPVQGRQARASPSPRTPRTAAQGGALRGGGGGGRWCWLGGCTGGVFRGGDTQTRIWQVRRRLQGETPGRGLSQQEGGRGEGGDLPAEPL